MSHRVPSFVMWSCLASCLLLSMFAGCGSHRPERVVTASPTGSVRVTVAWPARGRLVPGASNSIAVSVTPNGASSPAASAVIARPTTQATLNDIPAGPARLTAAAFPNSDGTGVAQASASTSIIVPAGTTTSESLTLVSTVTSISVTPSSPSVTVGGSVQLTATAKNAGAETVLVKSITWASSDAAVATVDVTGKVTGVSAGSAQVTATDPESGKSGGVTIAVTSAGKPAALPQMSLFSASSVFNQALSQNAALDPNSAAYVSFIAQDLTGIALSVGQYSTTVFFADSSTPRVTLSLPCGSAWELGVTQLKDVPIPDFAVPSNDVDGADNPVVAGQCGDSADQDNNMVVIDTVNRCEYDMWQARKVNGQWEASWATALSIDSDGVHSTGLSIRGSGFAFLGGVIWPHELEAGRIPHKLVFNMPPDHVRGGGPVSPATESDGTSTNPNALPEGSIVRLDPTLDLNSLGLTSYERTIAQAMQEYGMILCDNGGAGSGHIGLYLVDPDSVTTNPYAGILPDGDFVEITSIPLNRLQVLQLPAQDPNFQNKLQIPSGGCAVFQ